MEIEKLSEDAIEYCNDIRGKNYEGCGSDYEFCKLCRENANTWEQLDNLIKRTNAYVNNNVKN